MKLEKSTDKIEPICNVQVLIMYKNVQYIREKKGNTYHFFHPIISECCPSLLTTKNQNFDITFFNINHTYIPMIKTNIMHWNV